MRHKGVVIKRLLLRRSARNYADDIDAYLRGRILERAAEARRAGDGEARRGALSAGEGVYGADWTDVGGLLMPRERLRRIEDGVAGGELAGPADLDAAFAEGRRRVRGRRVGVGAGRLAGAHRHLDGGAHPGLPRRDRGRPTASQRPPSCAGILADAEKEFNPIAPLRIRPRGRRGRPRPRLRGRARRLRRQRLRAADAGAPRRGLNPSGAPDSRAPGWRTPQLGRWYLGAVAPRIDVQLLEARVEVLPRHADGIGHVGDDAVVPAQGMAQEAARRTTPAPPDSSPPPGPPAPPPPSPGARRPPPRARRPRSAAAPGPARPLRSCVFSSSRMLPGHG